MKAVRYRSYGDSGVLATRTPTVRWRGRGRWGSSPALTPAT